MLQVKSINVFYGSMQALWNVSIEVKKGEIVAIIGSNGAGKTTTLMTISGILRPKPGEIYFNGTRIDSLEPFQIVDLGISHVPEGRRVFPYMTVLENLLIGAYTPRAKKRIKDSLEFVFNLFPRLKERKKQLANTLSGGEQQMLAIGRGLMASPSLLMLDEPSLGLAPNLVDAIFDVIEQIRKEGVTILLVEQNVREALEIADRAYVLETGKIVMEGKAKELLEDERIKKAYLGI